MGARWKLWHLSALVALAALAFAAEARLRGSLPALLFIGLFLSPPLAAAWFWDRFLLQFDEENDQPRRLGEVVFSRATWFVFFLIPYLVLVPLVLFVLVTVLHLSL
jgi:hypothetical protein